MKMILKLKKESNMETKHSYEEFINGCSSKEEMFNYLNEFFGLKEDGKEEEFLKWYYGDE